MGTDEHVHCGLYRLERPSEKSVGLELGNPNVVRFLVSALQKARLPQRAEIGWRVVSLRAWAMLGMNNFVWQVAGGYGKANGSVLTYLV
jgi:hypothetical protein